jgi:hypothetical protein
MATVCAQRQAKGASALRALVDGYLSEQHPASVESGCPVAALASEIPRQSAEVRAAAAQRIRGLMARVQAALPSDAAPDSAAVIASQLVGALQLGRALGGEAEGKALLAAARRNTLAQYDPAAPHARAARRAS